LCLCHPTVLAKALCFQAVHLPCLFNLLSGQLKLSQYLMNSLDTLDKTDRECSLTPTDDLIPEVKGQGRGGDGIHIQAGVSKSIVHLLVRICTDVYSELIALTTRKHRQSHHHADSCQQRPQVAQGYSILAQGH